MQNRIYKNTLLISAAAMGAVMGPAAVQAQDQRDSIGFEVITVTSQRREQNLQDVPLAVTALNAAQIEQRFSRDLLDLGSIAPNLIIDPILGNGTAAISIRGIQLNDVEKSFDPPVGVYLDGVYLASTTGALLNIFDAETVEVLRGPQGTLFGRNTIGGLVHVRRNKPTGELEGKANITYGSFDRFDLQGVINFPTLGDGFLNAKISAVRLDGGGYFFNTTRNEREGDNNLFMVTPMIQLNPSEDLEINIIYDYIRDRTDTRPVTSLTTANQTFGALGGLGAPASDEDFHRTTRTSLEQTAFLTTHSITLNGTYQLDERNEVEAIFNYRDTDEGAVQEFDGVEALLFNTNRPQQIDQFSAELRWHGDFDNIQAVAGLYYFNSDYNINQRTFFPGFGLGEVAGGDFQQSTQSYAVFAQVDWEVVDRLTLTLGGRYLYDDKSACGGTGQGTPALRTLIVSYGDCSADRVANGNFSNDILDGEGAVVGSVVGNESWDRFTPRIAVSYELDNGLLFAAYSQGFRSGGFNGRGTDQQTHGPYDPELVKNYEVGLKSDWLDRRLIVNLTGFYTDYEDKQEDVVFPSATSGTVTVVQNAASATIWGLEAELRAMPAEGLSLGLNIGYLDAQYDEYIDIAQDGVTPIDKSDFLLRRAPQWTLQADINYEYQIDADSSVIFGADYAFKDDYSIVANTVSINDPNPGLIDAFGLLNASIAYQTQTFKLSLFGRNLTGADYFQHVLDVGTNFNAGPNGEPIPDNGLWTFGTINAPTTWGIQGEIRF